MTEARFQTTITRTPEEVEIEKILKEKGVIRSIKDIYRRGLSYFAQELNEKK